MGWVTGSLPLQLESWFWQGPAICGALRSLECRIHRVRAELLPQSLLRELGGWGAGRQAGRGALPLYSLALPREGVGHRLPKQVAFRAGGAALGKALGKRCPYTHHSCPAVSQRCLPRHRVPRTHKEHGRGTEPFRVIAPWGSGRLWSLPLGHQPVLCRASTPTPVVSWPEPLMVTPAAHSPPHRALRPAAATLQRGALGQGPAEAPARLLLQTSSARRGSQAGFH